MSDPEDDDFEGSREPSGSEVDAEEDSGDASETRERPQRLKLTLKPRAPASSSSTPRGKGTGRPRGRPKGSGSGLTLKVRRSKPDIAMDDQPEVPPAATPQPAANDNTVITSVGGKSYVKVGEQLFLLERDNLVTREDPIGNTKIDMNGNLLGGREFKAATFHVPTRNPDVKYMLAIDCARSSGYRDSLYYFRRNPLMYKLQLTAQEKEYLIAAGKLHTNLRHRSVTMVTARSAFKQHGAKVIKNGRWVVDDYFEDAAKIEAAEKGAKPGDIVIEPQQDFSHNISVDAYSKAQKESRTGIYKPGGPTTFFGSDGVGPFRGEMSSTKKAMLARENLTEENWMHAAALSIQEANEELRRGRAERIIPGAGLDEVQAPVPGTNLTMLQYVPSATPVNTLQPPSTGDAMMDQFEGGEVDIKALEAANAASPKPCGVYEVHTGTLHYPQAFQPTKVRWVPARKTSHKPVIGGLSSVGSAAWGLVWIDYVMKDEGAYNAELERIARMEAEVIDAEKNGPPAIPMDWDT
ncbi:SubName: Full=Uncharacterized protein {ECO:0000313/EMBL:CCA73855.1} [Serendipita indica DSM 11827]|uniref:Uncharacterized protein n=1 Tax=Serendipita indica (strain DSM 11827) TaxID=1109443 RepID=G4TRB2_SERID|nr:SubName: Full=Uncharacterized protein {ECO:0000313/EMBL:CCA73855.1} [Serendipita indica DSM 11827]CCA73855.1 hypothetical protein PIIN_07809 [Serendipita indica DSM 11827]